jgi:transcriptional regulator with XRE-family HTH domain
VNYEAVRKQVGLAIRQFRIKKGLSQEALARNAGLSRTFLTGVETGTRNLTLQTMSRLADALDVCVGEFFGSGHENKPVPQPGHSARRR